MNPSTLNGLNEAQRKAVTHGEGPLLVLAGPGSGKTLTITSRVSYLIGQRRIPPENILVITFTKEAALSMQERFLRQEQSGKTIPVRFGTFHALFYHIIRQYTGNTNPILRESEKKNLILPIIVTWKKHIECDNSGDAYEEAGNLLSAISYYKNTKDADKAAEKLNNPWREHFKQLLEDYEKARMKSGRLDFDDMAYECLKRLNEDKSLLLRWQKQFCHILIDEFQDINPIQYEIINMLSTPPHNLFAVGDDDQSIYGFRGSDPKLMRLFLQDYPGARQVFLDTNYRSRTEIVQASLKVINENQNRFPKELKASERAESMCRVSRMSQFPCPEAVPVLLKPFREKEEQDKYLLNKFIEILRAGQLEQCAVLFRTNMQMQGFASLLSKASVPYSMKERSVCIYDHFIAKDLNAYLKFSRGNRKRSIFLSIMNKPSRWIGREALPENIIDFEKLREYYRQNYPDSKSAPVLDNLRKLEKGIRQLAVMKPGLGLKYIRKGLDYERYLREKAGTDREKWKEWMNVLDWLTEDGSGFNRYEDWLSFQDSFRREMERNVSKKEQEQKGVRLMTAHASKGLEFPQVFIPDINEGSYPHGNTTDRHLLEEERRMLYVAMTRAKEALELLFVTGTKEHPKLPSRFLNPLL